MDECAERINPPPAPKMVNTKICSTALFSAQYIRVRGQLVGSESEESDLGLDITVYPSIVFQCALHFNDWPKVGLSKKGGGAVHAHQHGSNLS